MTVYYIVIAVIAALWALLGFRGITKFKSILFLAIAFLLLAGLSALRYGIGYDYTLIYAPLYFYSLSGEASIFGSVHEPGFMLLEKLISFVTPNYQAVFVVTGVLIVGLLFFYYYRYSPNVFLSVLLFLLLGQYYCSLNFVRQTLAAVIALFAIPFLKKRKLCFYVLVVLIAALFHKSALIMLPFYFINLIPVSRYTLPAYVAFTAVVYIFSRKIVSFVTKYWYSVYSEETKHVLSTFEVPFTISMTIAFVLLFFGYKQIRRLNRDNYIYINYAFFSLFFVLMGTRVGILDRLSLYFELVIPIAAPVLLKAISQPTPEESRAIQPAVRLTRRFKGITVGEILLCLFFCIWGLSIHQYILTKDHHGVVPYQWIFNQPVYSEYTGTLKNDRQGAQDTLLSHWENGDIYSFPVELEMEPEDFLALDG